MTRETKIGLLVGLAFIIVIGILLSDHLTTRGELPQAQLTEVGNNVRTAAVVPAGNTPPITPVAVPSGVSPANPVPMQAELNQKPATAIVQVGPAAPGDSATVDVGPGTGPLAMNNNAAPAGSADAVVTRTPTKDDKGSDSLAAITNGTTPANDPNMIPVPASGTTPAVVKPAVKEYKAEKGDTVSRMASRLMGGNTNANRKLIIDANPALKADPAKVVVGHTYLIPLPAELAKETTPVTDSALNLIDSANGVKTETAKADKAEAPAKESHKSSGTTTYVTKDKDTLWKIASSQLGDGTLWKEIRDLNKDVLKGKDVVHAGMTLKLPAKTSVASR